MKFIFFIFLFLIFIFIQYNNHNNNNILLNNNKHENKLLINRQLYNLHNIKNMNEKNEINLKFSYLSYTNIFNEMNELAINFPQYVKLQTTQDLYDLSSPGTCENNKPCKQYILTLTNMNTLPDKNRPELFLSGALHGNERIGPSTVTYFAKLIVYASACIEYRSNEICNDPILLTIPESQLFWLNHLINTRTIVIMPMTNSIGYSNNKREENGIDPNRDFSYNNNPKNCMKTITARSVNEVWRDHIFQIAITFHGGTTAITYEWGSPNHPGKMDIKKNKSKTKAVISPDELSQYDISKGMRAFGGKFKNEKLYPFGRINDIVYSVWGGMEDWAYAGSWENDIYIKNGDNDNLPLIQCDPKTNGGYDKSKTIYDNSTLRAFNLLVETSNSKSPSENTLGSSSGIFFSNDNLNGHITRNIRLCLYTTDIIKPYLLWRSTNQTNNIEIINNNNNKYLRNLNEIKNENNIKSTFYINNNNNNNNNNNQRNLLNTNTIINYYSNNNNNIPVLDIFSSLPMNVIKSTYPMPNFKTDYYDLDNIPNLLFSWSIAGSINIDETKFHYGILSASDRTEEIEDECNINNNNYNNIYTYNRKELIKNIEFDRYYESDIFNGNGKWSNPNDILLNIDNENDLYQYLNDYNNKYNIDFNGGDIFNSEIDINKIWPKDNDADHIHLYLWASAKVDKNWSNIDDINNRSPAINPQSHLVNLRTNKKWYAKKFPNKLYNDKQNIIEINGEDEFILTPLFFHVKRDYIIDENTNKEKVSYKLTLAPCSLGDLWMTSVGANLYLLDENDISKFNNKYNNNNNNLNNNETIYDKKKSGNLILMSIWIILGFIFISIVCLQFFKESKYKASKKEDLSFGSGNINNKNNKKISNDWESIIQNDDSLIEDDDDDDDDIDDIGNIEMSNIPFLK